MVTCRTFSKPTLILLSVLKQNSLFSPNLPNLTNSPNFPNSHAIQFQWFSTFLSCGTFKGSFFAAHFNTKKNLCCTPTLYIVGQIWWETYYSSQFYNFTILKFYNFTILQSCSALGGKFRHTTVP